MIYKKIKNIGLGMCHIIKENKYGYLVYAEKNNLHFIITSEIKDDRFYCNQYFNSLDEALNYFNKLERGKINEY